MTRTFGSGPLLLGAFLAILTLAPPALKAADEYSTGAETWEFNDKGDLSTPNWPIESLFKMTMRVLTPDEAKKTLPWDDKKEAAKSANEKAKKAREDAPKDKKEPADSPVTLPELEYHSDRQFGGIGTITLEEGEEPQKIFLGLSRSVDFDAQRRAVRILDVVTNSSKYVLPFEATFTTAWQPEIIPKLAKYRYLSPKQNKAPGGILVTTTGKPKLPILMFVFGNDGKGWKRVDKPTKEALSWSYTGWIDPGHRVVILHWLTLIDDVRTATLKETRAALIRDGMPNDDSLNDQVLKELINYPMPAEPEPDESDDPALAARRLYFVNQLCEALKIERHPEKDHLSLGADGPLLQGKFSGSELRLKTGNGEQSLPLEEIAAIQGSAGISRNARVYMRDGTIASGSLTWKDATFNDARLGSMKLSPASLDRLILKSSERDFQPVQFAALWMSQDGDIRGLTELPAEPAHLRWAGGDLSLAWPEVVSLRQLPPPELGHEVLLKDGSRIRGWLSPAPAASCLAYATNWADLTASFVDRSAPKQPSALSLHTAEGSVIPGTWEQDSLTLATPTADLKVPVAEIRTLTVKQDQKEGALVLEILTENGSTLTGQPALGTLGWKWSGKTLALPWPQIAKIAASPPASVPTPPAISPPAPSPASPKSTNPFK